MDEPKEKTIENKIKRFRPPALSSADLDIQTNEEINNDPILQDSPYIIPKLIQALNDNSCLKSFQDELFCRLYVIGRYKDNATQCYLKTRPGVKETSAKVNGHLLLTNTNVNQRIAQLRHKILDSLTHTEIANEAEIMGFLTSQMRSTMQDVGSWGSNPSVFMINIINKLKDGEIDSDEALSALNAMLMDPKGIGVLRHTLMLKDSSEVPQGIVRTLKSGKDGQIEIKLSDNIKAAQLLGQVYRMFGDKKEDVPASPIDSLDINDLEQLVTGLSKELTTLQEATED